MHYLAILAATVAQFIIGAIWYMPIFGKLWGKMHGFDELRPEAQAQARKGMGPFLALQFLTTLVTSTVLSIFMYYLPAIWSVYVLAGFFWIGFVVPTQVGAVVFGGTQPKWIVSKILIMAGGSLLCLEAAAIILNALST